MASTEIHSPSNLSRPLTPTSAIPENLQILSHANSTPVGCIDANGQLSVIKRHKLKNTQLLNENVKSNVFHKFDDFLRIFRQTIGT